MKEQWKKLDSDAKLLVDVEEGNQQPIKINIPLSALTPQRDEFCCNRLLTVLRVCVLLALLTLIGWTATTLYASYYEKAIPTDERSLENTFAFQNLVSPKKDAVEAKEGFDKSETDEFKDSTKKALDLIAAQMKGFNERLDQIQVEKEQRQMEVKIVPDDVKPIDEEVVTSERSDQTLYSIFDELAEKVGLADNQQSGNVVVEYKPELDAIILTEPIQPANVDLQAEPTQEGEIDLMALFKQLGIERGMEERANIDQSHEESGYQTKLVSDVAYQPVVLNNMFWNEKSNEDAQFDAIIRNGHVMDDVNEEAQKEYFGMMDRIAAEALNIDESHEEDKQVDQVIQAMINRIATSNLENDNDREPQKEIGDKVENELMEELNGNVEEEIMHELISDPLAVLFRDAMHEAEKERLFSRRLDLENVEEMSNEDKAERQLREQLREDFENEMVTRFVSESLDDLLALEVMETMEEETKMENDGEDNDDIFGKSSEEKFAENESSSSLLDEILEFMANEDEDSRAMMVDPDPRLFDRESTFSGETVSDTRQPAISSEDVVSETKEINVNEQAPIQEEPSEKKPFIDMVPSVEYVKKIEENPFIPRVAKMLEPLVGQNHELLVWYYTHKDLPEFLRGADKWRVFGAKLLYDSNIKDYPADATIVSGLVFEQVYGGAEYPSSSEEIQSDLQQEIVNRLILKSYLNKMLLEGNAEAETLSQVIERHNEEKLKELAIDPQQLTSTGDFFEVDNSDNDDLIPVVQFDPFVDESREANEQRTQVLKAFGKTRNLDDESVNSSFEADNADLFASMTYKAPEPKLSVEAKENSEDLARSSEFETTKSSGMLDGSQHLYEFQSIEQPSDPSSVGWFSEKANEEDVSSTTEPETEGVNMNDYLFSYDDPFDW